MNVSFRMTSSSARMDFSRPTKSGTIICGKTTISRSGRTGKVWGTPGVSAVRGLGLVMALSFLLSAGRHPCAQDARG
ncbi:hypothetical protein [Ancylobacter sp. G4_0304]|uniref:hypothetical protein n=1 Tax=Ancylobacter sp. G4_0304 TaxID=3114289 RepID=UPI0039C5F33E